MSSFITPGLNPAWIQTVVRDFKSSLHRDTKVHMESIMFTFIQLNKHRNL